MKTICESYWIWVSFCHSRWLPIEGERKNVLDFFEYNANFPPSRWLPIEGCLRFGGWKQSVNYIEQGCLFAVFVGYYLKDILKNSFWNNAVRCHRSVLKSRMKRASFLHIAPWKSQETTAREGEKWALTCGSEVRCRVGFLTNKWMLAKLSFTLSKHRFCH